MRNEKKPKEITIWLWSLLIACVMALCFAVLYCIFYFSPAIHESLKNLLGSAGTGQLAPPKVAMCKLVEVILLGTPITRFLLAVFDAIENKKGGAE